MAAPTHPNRSEYSLATVDIHTPLAPSPAPSVYTRLIPQNATSAHPTSYGSTAPPEPHAPPPPASRRRVLLVAGLRMAAIFIVSCCVLGGTLWLALPTLEPEDRPDLRIPKSFAQLQALNALLKKYRDIYPYRIVVCFVTTYLFLQAFSLPGSMYLSILGGAVWGVAKALPLACACVATGATLCYLLSAALGPALHALPSWRARFATWRLKVDAQRANLIPFLIVLRIAPLPPHWVVNILCPHVGIGILPFWVSTFLGVFGVTVIHTTIGGGLDEMTSAKDFHLLSWRNFLGLSAIVVGVLIPVGLRYYFKGAVADVTDTEEMAGDVERMLDDEESGLRPEDPILAEGAVAAVKRNRAAAAQLVLLDDDEDDEDEGGMEAEDGDVILEAGPAIVVKAREEGVASSS